MSEAPDQRLEDHEFRNLTAQIFNAVIRAHGGTEEQAVEIDYEVTIDAMLYLTATMLEADRNILTNSALRMASKEAGARIHAFMRGMRRKSEATGKHHLEELAVFTMPDDAAKMN